MEDLYKEECDEPKPDRHLLVGNDNMDPNLFTWRF